MCPAFRHLSVIASLESDIVLNNIVCCVYDCIAEHPLIAFGHPSALGIVITGLVDRKIQVGFKEVLQFGEDLIHVGSQLNL